MAVDIFRQGSSMPAEHARVDSFGRAYERRQKTDANGTPVSPTEYERRYVDTLQISYHVATLAVIRGKGLDTLLALTEIDDPGCIHDNNGRPVREYFTGTWKIEKIHRQRDNGPASIITFDLVQYGDWEDDE